VSGAGADAFGIYVHYPYCAQRCPYCDFNVVQPGPEGRPDDRYRDAVLAELAARAEDYAGRPAAVSLYFGGGTPALWAPRAIGAIIEAVSARLGLTAGAEITVEANPGELDAARMVALRAVGVNRLSLGTQSFDAEVLRRLGRRNTPDDNRRCVDAARAAGFENLSLDLIQAVAGQSVEDALADVAAVLALGPEHVSTYELTIHPQTPFGARAARGEVLTADEDAQVAVYEATRSALRAGGVLPYEISNAARPGREAVHNGLYWRMAEYLALGAGAHGFRRVATGGERWENERHAGRYMEAALAGRPRERFRETLDAETLLEERAMTGLRLDAGLPVDAALEAAYGAAAARLVERGLLTWPEPTRWRLTERGRLLMNQVVAELTA
jgi:oxygen-independent coproporphyrinogen-3 oxidase